jgi:hypothetical protein
VTAVSVRRGAPTRQDDPHIRQLEAAQAALLARYAHETRVRRVAWSQGETQVLEFGDGPPLLLHLPWFDEPERVEELERFLTIAPTEQRRTA